MNKKIEDIKIKYLTGEATPQELQELEVWSKESKENEKELERLLSIWNQAEQYTPDAVTFNSNDGFDRLMNQIQDEQSAQELENKKGRVISLTSIAAIAAMFVLAISAYLVIVNQLNTVITSENQIQYVSLDDGTTIYLDQGSKLTIDRNFDNEDRLVKLSGRAFFNVQSDQSHPFIIQTSKGKATVMGTSFTVHASEDKFEVAVNSGVVSVVSGDEQVNLSQNQMSQWSESGIRTLEVNASEYAKWRNLDLSFEDAPMMQVIDDINLYHGNLISLTGTIDVDDCPFNSTSLKNTSVDDIVKIIELAYSVEVEKKEDGSYQLNNMTCH